MHARFLAPEAHAAGEVIALPDEEARHLTRVLRLGAGAVVRVFNGRGAEFDAVVDAAARGRVTVRLTEPRAPAPEARVAITLAQAVLKGDKMDDVVRDAVMLGAAAIQPIVTTRTEVTRAALERGRRRERWTRVAVASVKQCGRAVVPPILEPVSLEEALRAIAEVRLPSPAVMLVEPGAAGAVSRLPELDPTPPREATLLVGPEGGWTAEELDAAAACRLLTLGGRTLRADTMAVVAATALFAHWAEF